MNFSVGALVAMAAAFAISDGLLGMQIYSVRNDIDVLKESQHLLGATRPLPGYTPRQYEITDSHTLTQLGIRIASALDGKPLTIYCAGNCGPLADQLFVAVRDADGNVNLKDAPFANPGVWVSPSGDTVSLMIRAMIAKTIDNESAVNLDTVPGDGYAIVVSKMPPS